MRQQLSQFVVREVVPGEFFFVAPNTPYGTIQAMFETLPGLKFVAFQSADGKLVVRRHQMIDPVFLTTAFERPLVGILPGIPGSEWQFADEVCRSVQTTKPVKDVNHVLDQFVRAIKSIENLPIDQVIAQSMEHIESVRAESAQFDRVMSGQGRKFEKKAPVNPEFASI